MNRRRVALASALLMLTATDAFAYTDPGSGALLWQMGTAALLGAMFFVRRAAGWLRSLVTRRSNEPRA
jgi:hypothetical protein